MPKPSDPVPVPNRHSINGPLKGLSNSLMLRVLGNPRGTYTQDCQSVTNPDIRRLIVTANVGPFAVTGLSPAVETLRRVFDDVRAEEPEVYAALGSAGMLCARLVRNSKSAISNHSWGCAIDLTLDGILDRRGDGRAQRGLLAIHPIFNRHKMYWGVAFPTEDAMHFEVSEQLLLDWYRGGELTDGVEPGNPPDGFDEMSIGDRGNDVLALQRELNRLRGSNLDEDGLFGQATRAAVMQFQKTAGLAIDGIVGPATAAAIAAAVPI